MHHQIQRIAESNTPFFDPLIAASVLASALISASTVFAEGAVHHSGQASIHSANAVSHGLVSGAKVASGSAAVPLILIGSAGTVSGDAGRTLWEAADQPIGEPLPITEETIISAPSPDQAIRQ